LDETTQTNQPDVNDAGVEQQHETYSTDAPDEHLDTQLESSQAETVPEDDLEEIEHEGIKHRIPKVLKPALMMHADYTRKTQELAEQRKEAESARTRYLNADAEFVDAKAAERAIDAQLQQFNQVDWNAFFDNDPVQAQKLAFQMQQLRDAKAQAAIKTQQIESKRSLEQQQSIAKQYEQGQTVLKRDIPNWSLELASKISEFAAKEYGFQPKELQQIYDPRMVKALHAAMLGSQLLKKASQSSPKPEPVKPAGKVGGNQAPARRGLSDDMSMADWMKAHNARYNRGR